MPLYVISLDKDKNRVIVGKEEELYSSKLYANELNWLVFDKLETKLTCFAKIRYRTKKVEVDVYPEDNYIRVEFKEKQRAITPGQSVVFYDENGIVLGGGKILLSNNFDKSLVYSI